MEAIRGLCLLLTASGNLFWNMSDACEAANYRNFGKDFNMLLAVKEGKI